MRHTSDYIPLQIRQSPLEFTNNHATNENGERTMEDTQTLLESSQSLPLSATSTAFQTAPSSTKSQENLNEGLPSSTPPKNWIRAWSLEVISIITSIASLIALVVLLLLKRDKPLSSWTLPLSLNTIVSILAVIIKAPLAFVVGSGIAQGKWAWFAKRQGPLSAFVTIEEAGRGPLGCLSLLWKLKFRHWVSFGAAVTLGLLVIDPFIQGVITYEGDNSIVAHIPAPILRASTLDIGYTQTEMAITKIYLGAKFNGCESLYPDISMIATAQIGFFNMSALKIAEPPGMTCQTGNCTWPAYSTLGICNSCTDISSSHLNRTAIVGDFDECGYSFSMIANYTQYEIPYGSNRTKLVYRKGHGKFMPGQRICTQTRSQLAVSFRPQDTYNFRHLDTLMASFIVLNAPDDYWDGKIAWEKAKIQATECAMSYCIQTYHPKMTNGKIEHRLLSTSFERVQNSWQPFLNDSKLLKDIQKDVGKSLAPIIAFKDCGIIPRSDLQLKILYGSAGVPNKVQQVFNITQKSIQSTMRGIDEGVINSINKVVSNSTNITTSFNNAARLLSYRMGEIDATSVRGTTQQWVVYIRVRWAFLAAPVAMVLGGIIFASGVIAESQNLRLDTLKADPLKILLCGLDDETRSYIKVNKMSDDELMKAKIGLSKNENGMELNLKH